MRILTVVLYVLSGLTAVSFLFNAGFAVLMVFGAIAADGGGLLAGTGILGVLAMLAISLFTHTVAALVLMGYAELIRVALDIQQNTQEAAFHSKFGRQWS